MNPESIRRMVGIATRSGSGSSVSDASLLEQFIRDGSEESFRQMVERHGPMVFGVCRRVLTHREDAEDAYQATFLVLAKKASAVRPPNALGRWLYGTAFRTALRARERRRSQLAREHQVAEHRTELVMSPESKDWLPLLDQELNDLSARDRLPIILCDLLGRSRHEAAQELGIPEGTLSSRLARARLRLRLRLEKRGVIPAIASAPFISSASALGEEAILAPPIALSLAGELPQAVALADGVLQAMWIQTCVKWCAFVFISAVIVAAGAWFGPRLVAQLPKAPLTEKKENKEPAVEPENPDPEKREQAKLNGEWRVVSVEGRPQEAWVKVDLRYHFHNSTLTVYEIRGNARAMVAQHVFSLEPKLDPRGITMLGVRGWLEAFRPGIYRIDGEKLEICWCIDAPAEMELQERPKGFTVPKGSKLTQLIVLKRVGDGKDLIPHERIHKLRTERVDSLRKVMELLFERFPAGRDPVLNIVEVSDRLMNAEMELATNAKEVREAIEDNFKRLKKIEAETQQLVSDGKVGKQDYLLVKARRLDVEILLEQAKLK